MFSYSSMVAVVLAIVLTGFNPFNSFTQLIDNANGKVFTNRPFFNDKVIKERGIKSISGKEIHYKPGDKPRETEYFRSYRFNENGQLIQQFESVELTKSADTLVTFYDYDLNGNLSAIRQRDQFGNYARIYMYDKQGRVVKEEYRRNLSSFPNMSSSFLLGERFIVSSEKSTYENYEGHMKRIIHNNEGLPYKEIITYYNQDALIDEEIEKLDNVPGSKTTKFYYNEKNDLDSITVNSNITGLQNRSYAFAYDKQGNLLKKEEFKNGQYITQYQVLYDEETMLIDDVLVQNISTEFIKVLELRKYAYFGNYN